MATDVNVEDILQHDALVSEIIEKLFEGDVSHAMRPLVLESLMVAYIRRMALTVEQTAIFVGTLMPRVGKRLGDGESGSFAHLLVPVVANDIEPGDAVSDPALEVPRTVGDNPWHCGPAKHTTEDGTEYPHVTTTQGIRGHFAVLLWWNPDMGGFPEPWQSGDGSYKTSAEAAVEAKAWAEAEEIPFYG